jgi:hypothetical protein
MSLPCGVVVSAQGSPSDRKLAPRSAMVASVLEQVPGAPRQPIQLRHQKHVPGL